LPVLNMERYYFKKKHKIRKRRDFQSIYQEGRRIHSKSFVILLRRNDEGEKRLGITVSKKVGNAVKRNRIKRLLREYFRLNRDRFPDSMDVVFIARKDISLLKYPEVCRELDDVLKGGDFLYHADS